MTYYYSPFLTFFFIFFFFLIILIILFPNYLKRDIATPLGAANYGVSGVGGDVSTINIGRLETVVFQNMTLSDNEGGDDNVDVSFIPDFSIMSDRLVGFFHLKITSLQSCELVFRTVDSNGTVIGNTIREYNRGWTSVSINTPNSQDRLPLYNVYVPFDIPSLANKNTSHEVTVQIAATSFNGNETGTIQRQVNNAFNIQLSSADVYFLPY